MDKNKIACGNCDLKVILSLSCILWVFHCCHIHYDQVSSSKFIDMTTCSMRKNKHARNNEINKENQSTCNL